MNDTSVKYSSSGRICAGLLAHVDSGKTTLAEAMLYLGGVIRRLGRVDNKDAFLDTYDLERERGITIFSKQAQLTIGDKTVTLLDTPGHVDFSAEMERTLCVLDYAVLIISGADGVQSHTRTLWQLLKRYNIPVFIFVNKMDRPGTDRESVMADIKDQLGDSCIDFSKPLEKVREELAMCDEKALNIFLKEGRIPESGVKNLISERKVFPCFFGSALKLKGIDTFMEAMGRLMNVPEYPEVFGARVFKISRDSQGSRLTWMKITGGTLSVRMPVSTAASEMPGPDGTDRSAGSEKINQIRIYNGEKYDTADSVCAGTVCAVTGPLKTRAGDGLGAEKGYVSPVLEPVLTYSIVLPDDCDSHRAFSQLKQLEEEVPELHIVREEISGEILVQLMGEIQTEVLTSLISERFGLEVEFGQGRIIYKETIADKVNGAGHFEPLRHYAEVRLLLEPDEPGSGLSFAAECSEDELDRSIQRQIMTHLAEKAHVGVLTGSPLTDVKITLTGGRFSVRHTEGGDFRQAAYRAVRQGLMRAKSILLEPWYSYRLDLPAKQTGRAMADIEKMGGNSRILEEKGDSAVLAGTAPVSEMRGYQKEVAAYAGGEGRLMCSMAGYLPCHNAEEVIAASGYDPEHDTDNTPDSVFCSHGAGFIVPWYDVEKYMHTAGGESGDDTSEDRKPSSPKSVSSMSGDEDKELEEIFRRTYGEPKPRVSAGKNEIRASSDTGEEKIRRGKNRVKKGNEYLLVDGYNIIFSWDDLRDLASKSLEAARSRLMHILANYQGYMQINVILVIDAYKVEGFTGEVTRWNNIDVVYTKEAQTADQYIEKTVHELRPDNRVTVATSDGVEQVIIRGQGCLLMSATELKAEVERINREIRENYLETHQVPGNYLLDYADDEESRKLEMIRLGIISEDE